MLYNVSFHTKASNSINNMELGGEGVEQSLTVKVVWDSYILPTDRIFLNFLHLKSNIRERQKCNKNSGRRARFKTVGSSIRPTLAFLS